MTVLGPHYDAKHTAFAKQYCYCVKSYYRKSFSSVQPVVNRHVHFIVLWGCKLSYYLPPIQPREFILKNVFKRLAFRLAPETNLGVWSVVSRRFPHRFVSIEYSCLRLVRDEPLANNVNLARPPSSCIFNTADSAQQPLGARINPSG